MPRRRTPAIEDAEHPRLKTPRASLRRSGLDWHRPCLDLSFSTQDSPFPTGPASHKLSYLSPPSSLPTDFSPTNRSRTRAPSPGVFPTCESSNTDPKVRLPFLVEPAYHILPRKEDEETVPEAGLYRMKPARQLERPCPIKLPQSFLHHCLDFFLNQY